MMRGPRRTVLFLVGAVLASCSEPPSVQQAESHLSQWILNNEYLTCSDVTFNGEFEHGRNIRLFLFDAVCRHPTMVGSKPREEHFGLFFHYNVRTWEVRRLEDPEETIAQSNEFDFPLRKEVDRLFIRTWGIPLGIGLLVFLFWAIFSPGDTFGVQTRWYRLTRRSKTPHQTRSHYSITSIDADDRDERE